MRTDKEHFSIFSPEDKQFLERMFEVYPTIADKFDLYLPMSPMLRIIVAAQDARHIDRAGWVKREVDRPERIGEHMLTASLFAIGKFGPIPEGIDAMQALSMAMFHDVPEVIVGDFTPHDTITNADKHRLEALAAKALFEIKPEAYDQFIEYCEQKTPLSHWVHDCDKLDAVYTGLMYEAAQPAHEGKLFHEFADYTRPRLKTEEGRAMLAGLDEQYASILKGAREGIQARTAQR